MSGLVCGPAGGKSSDKKGCQRGLIGTGAMLPPWPFVCGVVVANTVLSVV